MLFYIGRLLKTKTKNVAILKFRLQSSLIALIFLLDLYDVRDITGYHEHNSPNYPPLNLLFNSGSKSALKGSCPCSEKR